MYPLKFTKVFKEKVWGGREFDAFFGFSLEQGKTFGESWEVSAHPHGPSVVAEGPWKGKSLPELVAQEGPKLVGQGLFDRFGGQFPLLIKYLDIHDKLSIQVHPGDDYARAHEGEPGKSECWYILEASADATLILGLAPGVTREVFADQAAQGRWDGLFREVSVAAGDFIHITPGTVHASLAGSVLLCEIQQSSDTTYRIYDFDRLEKGTKRPLHLEKALEVIDFAGQARISRRGTRPRRPLAGGAEVEHLVADPYFTVDKIAVTGSFDESAEDRFRIFSVIEGSAVLENQGSEYPMKAGETWFLPAGMEAVVRGRATLLRSVV